MARVRGRRTKTLVPTPTSVETSNWPPRDSTFVFGVHAAPRPDTSVIFSAMLKPGRKMRFTTSSSDMAADSSSVMVPLARAFALTLEASMPFPSSVTSMMTPLPSW